MIKEVPSELIKEGIEIADVYYVISMAKEIYNISNNNINAIIEKRD